jgi:hypothetical protein
MRIRIVSPHSLAMVIGVAAAVVSPKQVASQSASARPLPVHLEALAFDAGRNRLVLFGGGPGMTGQVIRPGETWEWTGQQWTIAVAGDAGPGGRAAHGMAYDPSLERVVLYGGVRDTAYNTRGVPLCDTWMYDGRRWARAEHAGCVTLRAITAPIYDPARRVLLLVEGGAEGQQQPGPTKLWRFQDSAWVIVDSAGPRRGALDRVAFDRARAVLVSPVFSGPDAGVWEWDGQRWAHRQTPMPPSRSRYSLAYDAESARVLLMGGRGGSPPGPLGDAWTWDGASWSQVPGDHPLRSQAPPPRMSATLLENPTSRGLMLFGGVGASGALTDLWQFDRAGWRRLDSGSSP